MPNNVVIDQSNNTVTTDTTSTQNQVLLSADTPDVVQVLQSVGEIVTISTPGPQGAQGIPGIPADISGYLTTASFNQFSASYNTASFSGSFSGDGSELQNIPASGIIGLNLSQIATGSVTASVSNSSGSFEIVSGSSSLLFVSRSGAVGVGTTTPRAKMEVNGDFRIGGSFYAISDGPKSFFVDRYSNNPFADEFGFRKSRGTSASPTAVISQDEMGGVEFYGYDGSTFIQAAKIYTNVDGPVSASSVPGRISFYVNNGTGSVTNEIVRMTSLGLVGIGKISPTARLDVSGSVLVTGSLRVSQGVTASLFGTASQALTASYLLNQPASSSYALEALSASYALTASYLLNQPASASYALEALSASYAISSSYSQTASFGGNFTASNLLVSNTITAQTIVVQTVTSSIVYSSGSNVFGNELSNTQVFTGSVSITGSLDVLGPVNIISGSFTASLFGTASQAVSASYVSSASFAESASFAAAAYTVVGSIPGRSEKYVQSIPAQTWSFDHNLGERYPEITVFDNSNNVIIPNRIFAKSTSSLEVYFSVPTAGVVTATVGGGIPAISQSFAGYVLSVDVTGTYARWWPNPGYLPVFSSSYANWVLTIDPNGDGPTWTDRSNFVSPDLAIAYAIAL